MNYLLDTCVVSELVRKKPDRNVVRWIETASEERLYLTVITLGELHKGIAKLGDQTRAAQLLAWVESNLAQRFFGRILDVNSEITACWGRLLGQAEQRGKPIPAIDAMIAATAVVHGLTVVTRNTDDMANCGIQIINPWLSSPR